MTNTDIITSKWRCIINLGQAQAYAYNFEYKIYCIMHLSIVSRREVRTSNPREPTENLVARQISES